MNLRKEAKIWLVSLGREKFHADSFVLWLLFLLINIIISTIRLS